MSSPLNPSVQGTSTRPYLIRALHDWCVDNGFTPYLAVYVDEAVRVPMEYVKNREIVLNVSFDATSGLTLGNEFIEFKARFGGVAREILVPVDRVVAIYARENGQGMAFPVPVPPVEAAPGRPARGGAPLAVAPAKTPSAPAVVSLPGLTAPAAGAPRRKPRLADAAAGSAPAKTPRAPKPPKPPAGGRPALKRVK